VSTGRVRLSGCSSFTTAEHTPAAGSHGVGRPGVQEIGRNAFWLTKVLPEKCAGSELVPLVLGRNQKLRVQVVLLVNQG